MAAVSTLAFPRVAGAAESPPPDAVAHVDEGSKSLVIRLGGIGFGTYTPRSIGTHLGGGGGVVVRLAEKVDAEASVFIVRSEDDTRLPIQLGLRRNFFVSPKVRPYVGAGARMTRIFGTGARNLWGVVTSYGTYVWFSQGIGLYAEANAGWHFLTEKLVPEVGASAGLAIGF